MENREDSNAANQAMVEDEEERIRRVIEQIEEVRQCISLAFADTQYPGDAAIMETYNRNGRGLFFFGERWQDMPVPTIRGNDETLVRFGPDAFRYYLPAFMIVSLDEPTMEFIAPIFVPPFHPKSYWTWEEFAERFEGMTPDQSKSLFRYVKFVAEACDEGAFVEMFNEAVATFWENPYFSNHIR